MLKANAPAPVELVANTVKLLCQLQEQFNEVAVSHWALLNALAEKDPSFGDLYLEHKGITEKGDTGQALSLRLSKMNELVAKLDKEGWCG